jgi:membrane associated rhomboid family serine protease
MAAVPGTAFPVFYALVVATGWASVQAPGAPPPRGAGRPWATIVALVLVGIPSILQLVAAPGLQAALERRPDELSDGQPWRLVTSLVVQDGGWPGTVFNLVYLALLGAAAERMWGHARAVIVWLVVGVGAQFWGLVVQPHGAGNSVANFGLAASLAVLTLLRGHAPARWLATACLVAALVLLAGGDVHGGAAVLGAAVALLLATWRAPARTRESVRG